MHWKTKSRLAAAAVLMAAFVSANAGTVNAGDKTVEYSATNVAMQAAQNDAMASLENFLDHALNDDGNGAPSAALKVALPVGDGGNEVIWVSPFRMVTGELQGVLVNQPNELPGLTLGDTVAFSRNQVRDWSIWGDDGRLYGNYTTRVMLPSISTDRAEELLAILSEEPLPPGW